MEKVTSEKAASTLRRGGLCMEDDQDASMKGLGSMKSFVQGARTNMDGALALCVPT